MWPGRDLIHVRTAYLFKVISHHKIIKCLIFSPTLVDSSVFKVKSIVFVLHKRDFWPLLKRFLGVMLIQQVIRCFVVNFNVGYTEFVGKFVFGSIKLVEQVSDYSRNDASSFPLITTTHGKGLTTTSLSVSEYGSIKAFKTVVDNWPCHCIEDQILIGLFFKDEIKSEIVLLLERRQFRAVCLYCDCTLITHPDG